MKKYIPILKNTKLFSGISEEEINTMLAVIAATVLKAKIIG